MGKPAQTTIPPHGYLVIWADKDTADPGLHAAFSLDAGGEELVLLQADGTTVIDSISFGEQRAGVSYGRFPDGIDAWSLLEPPTPKARNVRTFAGYLETPQMSPGHGFYSSPVAVTITCTVPGATIYYTKDGSEPYLTATSRPNTGAAVYSGPVSISKTTCLRATAIRAGWKTSPISTHTYIFVADVIKQCADGRSPGGGWPSGPVNGQVFDYAMDPDVVNNPQYRDLIDDALLAIPSISLVTNLTNLVDPARGIYVHSGSEGRDWERPVSVELIHPDGREGFQIDAGIRIRGGFSRGGDNPKHSFRLFFRSDYGPPVLKYPLFDAEGADEFENIDLRTRAELCLEPVLVQSGREEYIRPGGVLSRPAARNGPALYAHPLLSSLPQRPVLGPVRKSGAVRGLVRGHVFRRRAGRLRHGHDGWLSHFLHGWHHR